MLLVPSQIVEHSLGKEHRMPTPLTEQDGLMKVWYRAAASVGACRM